MLEAAKVDCRATLEVARGRICHRWRQRERHCRQWSNAVVSSAAKVDCDKRREAEMVVVGIGFKLSLVVQRSNELGGGGGRPHEKEGGDGGCRQMQGCWVSAVSLLTAVEGGKSNDNGGGQYRLQHQKALAGLRRINLEGLRWRVFDAKGQVLGRMASQISIVLQGKDKPTYTPYREDGDMCIVLNAKDICVTGRKLTNKFYRWHTGYVGHLKERSLKDQLAKDPTEVIRKAVFRMLPRNKLRDDRDRKLRIFSGSEHPFADRPLEPFVMPPRNVREMRPRAKRALIRAQKKAEQGNANPTAKKGDEAQVSA
ncbi:hypothetical protein ZIOFF_026270 [Zingiber officinale]|uniref:50S ribosomal protein L13 n=2 Tax=Zingiber officinale TaxID=94328 RepID=A0A8J5LEN9_ZINOF|nr:hypothetical protein ZIOFF_026270 [Zingiber officinale]